MPYDWQQVQDWLADVNDEFASGYLATVGTTQVPVTESVLRASWAAEQWGRDNTYQFSLSMMLADLGGTLPEVRNTITYRGSTYRIIGITQNRLTGQVQLHLGDA